MSTQEDAESARRKAHLRNARRVRIQRYSESVKAETYSEVLKLVKDFAYDIRRLDVAWEILYDLAQEGIYEAHKNEEHYNKYAADMYARGIWYKDETIKY